jgi:hypothetical protein
MTAASFRNACNTQSGSRKRVDRAGIKGCSSIDRALFGNWTFLFGMCYYDVEVPDKSFIEVVNGNLV